MLEAVIRVVSNRKKSLTEQKYQVDSLNYALQLRQ